MKFAKVLLMSLLVFPLLSCSKKEKDRLLVGEIPGANGATAVGNLILGQGGNVFSSAISLRSPAIRTSIRRGVLTIESIQITQDGTSWLELIQNPIEVEITDQFGSYFQINAAPLNVPVGEYHGVKIRISPNPTILESEITINPGDLNPYPWLTKFLHPTVGLSSSIGGEATFTSLDGLLVPFRVEQGKSTYLVLGLKFGHDEGNLPEWYLWAGVRATTLQPS